MRIYAEKMPDGKTNICTVSRSNQLHLTEPKPVAWGYFKKPQQAEYAVKKDVWPSQQNTGRTWQDDYLGGISMDTLI